MKSILKNAGQLKKLLLAFLLSFIIHPTTSIAQQSFPAKAIYTIGHEALTASAAGSSDIESRFGVYGVGNINEQALSQINAGGKLSCFLVPYIHINKKDTRVLLTNTCLSFNVNAINKDTLVTGTILFPDLGNAAFLGTMEIGYLKNGREKNDKFKYYYGLFNEFAAKKISTKDTNLYFNVISVIMGLKVGMYFKPADDKPLYSLTALIYGNYIHIPDKDAVDYQAILRQPNLDNSLKSLGCKITVGINNLQAYADMRHTIYEGAVTNRGLYSFNANIGIILPIEIKTNNNN